MYQIFYRWGVLEEQGLKYPNGTRPFKTAIEDKDGAYVFKLLVNKRVRGDTEGFGRQDVTLM